VHTSADLPERAKRENEDARMRKGRGMPSPRMAKDGVESHTTIAPFQVLPCVSYLLECVMYIWSFPYISKPKYRNSDNGSAEHIRGKWGER